MANLIGSSAGLTPIETSVYLVIAGFGVLWLWRRPLHVAFVAVAVLTWWAAGPHAPVWPWLIALAFWAWRLASAIAAWMTPSKGLGR